MQICRYHGQWTSCLEVIMKMSGFLWKCWGAYLSKIDSSSLVLIPDKNCFSFSDTSPVCCLLDDSGRGLSTLASLTVRVAFFSEHAMNVIAVRYYMDLTDTLMDVLWSSSTHTKCGYEVVNPLGARLDP